MLGDRAFYLPSPADEGGVGGKPANKEHAVAGTNVGNLWHLTRCSPTRVVFKILPPHCPSPPQQSSAPPG